jgi:hypothetical protein
VLVGLKVITTTVVIGIGASHKSVMYCAAKVVVNKDPYKETIYALAF